MGTPTPEIAPVVAAQWAAQGFPWRKEREIDGERKQFLAEKRAIPADEENNRFPFSGVTLTRADVEWLLATHESGGMTGPIDWDDPAQRARDGLDLRGAVLRGADLRGLPLARALLGAALPSDKSDRSQQKPRPGLVVYLVFLFLVLQGLDLLLTSLVPIKFTGWQLYGSALIGGLLVGGLASINRIAGTKWGEYLNYLTATLLAAAFIIFVEDFAFTQASDASSGYTSEWVVFGIALAIALLVFGNQMRHIPVSYLQIESQMFALVRSAGANLRNCNLNDAHLEGANLGGAFLTGASLPRAYLQAANFELAALDGADLRQTQLDAQTTFRSAKITTGGAKATVALGDIEWNGCDLSRMAWSRVRELGDERFVDRIDRRTLQDVVKLYREVSAALREAGETGVADRLIHRSLVLHKRLTLREDGFFPWLLTNALDLLAGYGYKPERTLFWYVFIIGAFAFAYSFFAPGSHVDLTPQGALILSITSFHGRGFFPSLTSAPTISSQTPPALDSPIIALAAAEAVIGLFIEVSIIATLTQRFFASRQ
jgi:uncharacterized protein YjbI with pentapeptide repeats